MPKLDRALNIMLVDDKVNLRKSIRAILVSLGFKNIVEADGGQVAVQKVRSQPVHLVLCDREMPEMTGVELLRALKDDEEYKDIPFIMLGETGEQGKVAEAGEGDVDAYLVKPFSAKVLEEKIAAVMEARLEPSKLDLFINLGQVYLKSRMFDEAMTEFQKALKENPRSPRAMLAMGQALEGQDKADQALPLYQKAVKLSPYFIKAHEALAALFKAQGNEDQHIVHLEAAVAISPRNLERKLRLGKSYLAVGRKEEANALFQEVVALAREGYVGVVSEVGDALLDAGMDAEATEILQEGLNLSPSDPSLYNRLGMALRKQKRYKEALQQYRLALDADPENENLYYNLGRAYFEAGSVKKAQEFMVKALEIYPEFEEAKEFLERLKAMPQE